MGVGTGTFFALFSTPCQEERSARAVTSTRPDCGWAPLMGIGAVGGSVAPEQVHQESWDSAPRGTCPLAGGQQGPPPPPPPRESPCVRTLVEKYRSPKPRLPSALTPGDAESYMSTEKGCFSLSLFLFFFKTTTSYNLKSCP